MTDAPWFLPRRELRRTLAFILRDSDRRGRSAPIAVKPIESCIATLRRAFDFGLNVVEHGCRSYEDGYSEQIVGQAVRDRRSEIFVIDKVDHLDRAVAPQVSESLAHLDLPSVDLLVFHGLSSVQDWRALIAPGGRLRSNSCARRDAAANTLRLAFSCHHPEVLREALRSKRCDVLMFPVGPFVDTRYVD